MEPINEPLWEIAKKRAKFKKSLFSYCTVVPFLWAIWYFTDHWNQHVFSFRYIPWPAWVTVGWGFSLACKFGDAYVLNTQNAIESEYEKLKNQ